MNIVDKFEYVGYNSHRLNDDDEYHEIEIAYVEAINKEIKQNSSFLAQIVGNPNRKLWLTEEEEKVALSVIQWLGTPVGQSFINKIQTKQNESI